MTDNLNLVFIDSHMPGVLDGDYRLTVKQGLSITAESDELSPDSAARYLYFSVAGPRFSLDPSLIKGVFPPDKGVGRYSGVLPHIILHRSTLPWEREISDKTPSGTPWLAVLLFVGDEIAQLNIEPITVGELQNPSTNPSYPGTTLEVSQSESDQAVVIDIPLNLLAKTLPSTSDLIRLAHVRELTLDGTANVGEANLFPIVVGNRLPAYTPPKTGCEVKAVLVSLEGRTDVYDAVAQANAAENTLPYRLVMLHTWQYTTLPQDKTFTDYVLDAATPRPNNPDNLLCMDSLTATDSGAQLANTMLQAGFIPLPHQTRQGNSLVSWYRGPFITQATPPPDDWGAFAGIRSPDQLVRYFEDTGMLDTSYAAAWQLGQLLTLQNTSVSTALYNWKRGQALLKYATGQTHLPVKPIRALPLPSTVQTWLNELAHLQHVPFNYLVANEQMLPSESIRFFAVDSRWCAALLDGAFSVGRVLSSDAQTDQPVVQAQQHNFFSQPISGFLLRSHVVEGWPRLQVEGYDSVPSDVNITTVGTPLPVLRMERLAPDILLCLFVGNVQTVDLHEVPETVHFGVSYDPETLYTACNLADGQAPSGWYKAYRLAGSAELYTDCVLDVGAYLTSSSGQVDITGLVTALAAQGESIDTPPATDSLASHSWWVAYQMIEGVQRVRLMVKTSS